MQLSYRQKAVLTSVFVFLMVILILGLAEGAVQLRQWLKYGHFGHYEDLFVVDEGTGLRVLAANAASRTININSQGFRGPPITQPKPAGDLRLAFLGASTTFCAEVSGDELTWPHLVTEAVQEAVHDINVDYVNGAMPGYVVQSSLHNLSERIAPFQPDVVVIYHATNDLSQETRWLAVKQGIYEEEGRSVKKSWLAKHSLLWYLVEKNLHLKAVQRNAVDAKKRLEFSPSKLGVQFRKELTQLVLAAKQISGVVALATFSYQIRPEQTPEQQLVAASSALYYMPFMTLNGLVEAYTQYNQIIADVARDTGAILIDVETAIPGDSKHFNDTVHFTDAGSLVMAHRVSEAVLASAEFQALVKAKRGGN